MDRLTVVRVEPFAPGDESAAVTLSSGQAEVTVFCWPCGPLAGDRVVNELHSGADHQLQSAAYLSDWPEDLKAEHSVPRLERWSSAGAFAARGCGRVVDAERGIVEVLGFEISFGAVSSAEGDVVEFTCDRLDLKA